MAMPTSYQKDYLEGSLQGQTQAQVERNAIETADWLMVEAGNLAERVKGAVDRICGHAPSFATSEPVEKIPSTGVLPALKDRSERMLDVIRRAQSALERLDRSI
jgi:hypothetical protein